MTTLEQYEKVFCETFEISVTELPGLTYQNTPLWDSIGHMSLIAEIEESFDIMMETDDIIGLSSFEKGMEILTENYQIEF